MTGQRLSYSVGFTLPTDFETPLRKIPMSGWSPAYDADGGIRDGAFVAEATGLLDLASWRAFHVRLSRRRVPVGPERRRGPRCFWRLR